MTAKRIHTTPLTPPVIDARPRLARCPQENNPSANLRANVTIFIMDRTPKLRAELEQAAQHVKYEIEMLAYQPVAQVAGFLQG